MLHCSKEIVLPHFRNLYSSALSLPTHYSAAAGSAVVSTLFIWSAIGAMHGLN